MAGHKATAFVSLPRAKHPTALRLGAALDDAEAFVFATVRQLRNQDFVEAVLLSDTWFDVYGCVRDGLGWYVKLNEGDDGLVVISHHEPEFPLTTISGLVIRPTASLP